MRRFYAAMLIALNVSTMSSIPAHSTARTSPQTVHAAVGKLGGQIEFKFVETATTREGDVDV